jgi:hypothetical protein
VTTEFLQIWRYANEQNNISLQASDMALQRFTRRLGEAKDGKGELLPLIQKYNIALTDSAGKTRSNLDVLGDFQEILKNTEDPAVRLAIAMKMFDSEGAAVAKTLVNAENGLEDFAAEMRETNKLISEDNVAALKRASDAMTSFGTELKATFANATAEVWSTVEAIMFLASEREKDAALRERAVANLAGLDFDSLPTSERARQLQLGRARREQGLTNAQIDAEVERLKVEAILEQIKARKEELAVVREQEAAAAAAAKAEADKAALAKQRVALETTIAEHEEQLRYERLSTEDKLAFQLERRAALEEEIKNTVLSEDDHVKKLQEQEQVLKRIVDLRLKIEAANTGDATGPEGPTPGSGRSTADPLQNFADRMQDAQNPQLIILNSMEAMYESINAQVQDLIAGTITWEQALRNVGGAVLSAVISTFAQMAAAAIASYVATQIGIQGMQATAMSATMAQGTAAAAAWIPAAIAASIATLGSAAGVGAASFALAMLSGAAAATLGAGLAGVGMAAMGAGSSIPGRATGGPVQRGQLYKVGEQGEELFAPGMTGTIIPNDQTQAIMDGLNSRFQAPRTQATRLETRQRESGLQARSREKPRETTVLNIDGPNALADAIERQRGDLIQIKRRLGMA